MKQHPMLPPYSEQLTVGALELAVQYLSSSDAEGAHAFEDDLRARALAEIAKLSCSDPARLAAVALSTSTVRFGRWYS